MKGMKIGDFILIGMIVVIAGGLFLYSQLIQLDGEGQKVVIEVDGKVMKIFDLPQPEAIEYKVQIDQDDYNLVQIEGNRVRVVEATCPEQVDVHAGWISKPGEMLVCLPHKLIIQIAGEQISDDEVDVKTF